ncbi:hypothetical protein MIMGU_mgv1a008050mg [Erythranthe guttata]|uniref:Uncharacterized protein n=1 Tax=Erythranthe guttata TaxID=4155 RepID=A0A022RL90_ERYGU|nr:PREDICTED: uncharacterized protein LOC105954670 isoform X1 [Erythranthe guttata]EYU40483.1 hypothetical protein MIMGU_mgv1a008050mg [Erythranthe guttata]|eukprot:XP_012833797.1 PREDICTED: uncharacterized protein LOC105954670 isoform X1 [Erythranthe guttata]
MAAFSTNTNILSSHSQQRRHLPHRFSSNFFKTHSSLHFFPLYNKNLNSPDTTTAASPIFAAPPHASAAVTTTGMDDFASTSTSTEAGWAEFGEKVSGEWDGFGADFTVEGKPIELPEMVVPEAYREWEVKVFDWQTQCPTLADQNQSSLIYKTIKLLPTVGCEADAATRYNIHERSVSVTQPHNSAFAYQSTGCYVALWPSSIATNKLNNSKSIEVEHCLINPSDKESRVRIIQVLEQSSEMKMKSISVFVEQWYGPFRNGDQLGGCAIRDSAFAATQPLKASQLSGVWEGLTAVATFHTSTNNMIQQVGDECECKSIRYEDDGGLILLPKQLWCSLKKSSEDKMETWCEVGWLLDEGRAITSKCTFSSTGDLKEIAIARETATRV